MSGPHPNSKLHAFLTTARLPNVPSVISNVWFGVALGIYWFWARETPGQFALPPLLLLKAPMLALGGVLLYLGGNFLNDWQDRDWDAKHRPERALPQNLFHPLSYLLHAIRFLVLGLAFTAFGGWWSVAAGLGIVLNIVVYTRWHKVAVWPVVPMGLCRALLPVMGFLAMRPPAGHQEVVISLSNLTNSAASHTGWETAGFIALHAAGLFGWIAGLTLNARYESIGTPPAGARAFARFLLILPLLTISAYWLQRYRIQLALIGAVPLVYWMGMTLGRKRGIGPRVSMLLAGIPLVEWTAALPLAVALSRGQSLLETPLTGVTLLLPAAAFLLARRLQQRIAAT